MLEGACGDRPFYTVWWKDAIGLERVTLPSVKTSLEGGRPPPLRASLFPAPAVKGLRTPMESE